MVKHGQTTTRPQPKCYHRNSGRSPFRLHASPWTRVPLSLLKAWSPRLRWGLEPSGPHRRRPRRRVSHASCKIERNCGIMWKKPPQVSKGPPTYYINSNAHTWYNRNQPATLIYIQIPYSSLPQSNGRPAAGSTRGMRKTQNNSRRTFKKNCTSNP